MKINKEKSKKILLRIIQVLAFFVLLTPLIADPGLNYRFLFPKATVFQIIIQSMTFFWILLLVVDKRYRPNLQNSVILGVIIFIASLAVTVPFSIDIQQSLWSVPVRMSGLVNYLHFLIWTVILFTIFDKSAWKKFFTGSIFVAVLICILGFLSTGVIEAATWRMLSTLGNPLFLAAYLLPNILFASYYFIEENRIKQKLGYFSALLTFLVALFMTSSRGPILGLAVGVFIFCFGLVLISKISKIKKVISVFAVIGLVVVSIGSIAFLQAPQNNEFVDNYVPKAISRIANGVIEDRIALWGLGIDAFKVYPITGWGLNNQRVAINQMIDVSGKHEALKEPWYDRFHNQMIELLATAGLIGTAGYLFMWTAFGVFLIREILKRKEKKEKVLLLAIFAFGVTHFVQNLFLFDVHSTLVLVYAIFAFAAIQGSEKFEMNNNPEKIKIFSPAWIAIVLLVGIVISFTQYHANLLPYYKYRQNEKGVRLIMSDPEQSLELITKSFTPRTYLHGSFLDRVTDQVTDWSGTTRIHTEIMEEIVRFNTAEQMKKCKKIPFDFQAVAYCAQSNRILYDYEPEALELAKMYANKSIEINPKRAEPYRELSMIALIEERYEDTIVYAEKAMENSIDRKFLFGKMNMRIALANLYLGNFNLSFEQVSNAASFNFPVHRDLNYLIALSEELDEESDVNWFRIIDHIDRAWTIFGDRRDMLEIRATIHHYAGNDKLVEAIIRIIDFQSLEDGNAFREKLGLPERVLE